ncbi:MAG: acyl-CoA reductase [Deltaproteobacteria bacterium]|jgi:hypothetical protein|nr:acyl-CoA reductase [Deltaproteobacteria bacterium]
MSSVDYLIGSEEICHRPLKTFDEQACAMTADFSTALMADLQTKAMPDVLTLAFWCRKANISHLRESLPKGEHRLGRGLAFHIAPANIPVNFAFSYIFSVLAGNANLVRVPSRPFAQIPAVVRVLKSVLSDYPEIEKRTALVSYPADDAVTAAFCNRADVRIIWGGDATVTKIRAMKSKLRCQDICFPDRFSFAVLNGRAVAEAGETELQTLANDFYNDTFLMDQNACSSPQIIFWQNSSSLAKEKFWAAVESETVARYNLQATSVMDKFDQSCREAVELAGLVKHIQRHGNPIYRISLSDLPEEAENRLRGSCGYFYEFDLADFGVFRKLVTDKCQTVTYYGLDPQIIRNFVIDEGLKGVDRIVPVGSALDISLIWDGFDLIRSFSRLIDLTEKHRRDR